MKQRYCTTCADFHDRDDFKDWCEIYAGGEPIRRCKVCGGWHPMDRWPGNCMPEQPQRSDLPMPYVISDTLPGGVNGLYHHAALRKFDSKSAYRRATKERGCIEVGNEYAATTKRVHQELARDVIESGINQALQECSMDDGKGDDSITVVTEAKRGKGVWKNAS